MRRRTLLILSFVMLLSTWFVGGHVLARQDGTPASGATHPLVGSWLVNTSPEGEPPLELATLSADGTMIDTSFDGANGHGAWEPTGDRSGIVTFVVILEDSTRLLIRASIEVSEDGQSFTGTYTNEFFDTTGQGTGEIGPGPVTGTRINAEAPGTPVASFEQFFGAPGATPAATPAS